MGAKYTAKSLQLFTNIGNMVPLLIILSGLHLRYDTIY